MPYLHGRGGQGGTQKAELPWRTGAGRQAVGGGFGSNTLPQRSQTVEAVLSAPRLSPFHLTDYVAREGGGRREGVRVSMARTLLRCGCVLAEFVCG